MMLDEFRGTLKASTPPAVTPALVALWHDARGDWHARTTRRRRSKMRGDPGRTPTCTARKGTRATPADRYRRAGKPVSEGSLDVESARIVTAPLSERTRSSPSVPWHFQPGIPARLLRSSPRAASSSPRVGEQLVEVDRISVTLSLHVGHVALEDRAVDVHRTSTKRPRIIIFIIVNACGPVPSRRRCRCTGIPEADLRRASVGHRDGQDRRRADREGKSERRLLVPPPEIPAALIIFTLTFVMSLKL